jgi:hypothetical protein
MIDAGGDDRYYIMTWRTLRNLIVRGHKDYLAKHGGMRPKQWESLHSAISEETLRPYRDKWSTVKENLM